MPFFKCMKLKKKTKKKSKEVGNGMNLHTDTVAEHLLQENQLESNKENLDEKETLTEARKKQNVKKNTEIKSKMQAIEEETVNSEYGVGNFSPISSADLKQHQTMTNAELARTDQMHPEMQSPEQRFSPYETERQRKVADIVNKVTVTSDVFEVMDKIKAINQTFQPKLQIHKHDKDMCEKKLEIPGDLKDWDTFLSPEIVDVSLNEATPERSGDLQVGFNDTKADGEESTRSGKKSETNTSESVAKVQESIETSITGSLNEVLDIIVQREKAWNQSGYVNADQSSGISTKQNELSMKEKRENGQSLLVDQDAIGKYKEHHSSSTGRPLLQSFGFETNISSDLPDSGPSTLSKDKSDLERDHFELCQNYSFDENGKQKKEKLYSKKTILSSDETYLDDVPELCHPYEQDTVNKNINDVEPSEPVSDFSTQILSWDDCEIKTAGNKHSENPKMPEGAIGTDLEYFLQSDAVSISDDVKIPEEKLTAYVNKKPSDLDINLDSLLDRSRVSPKWTKERNEKIHTYASNKKPFPKSPFLESSRVKDNHKNEQYSDYREGCNLVSNSLKSQDPTIFSDSDGIANIHLNLNRKSSLKNLSIHEDIHSESSEKFDTGIYSDKCTQTQHVTETEGTVQTPLQSISVGKETGNQNEGLTQLLLEPHRVGTTSVVCGTTDGVIKDEKQQLKKLFLDEEMEENWKNHSNIENNWWTLQEDPWKEEIDKRIPRLTPFSVNESELGGLSMQENCDLQRESATSSEISNDFEIDRRQELFKFNEFRRHESQDESESTTDALLDAHHKYSVKSEFLHQGNIRERDSDKDYVQEEFQQFNQMEDGISGTVANQFTLEDRYSDRMFSEELSSPVCGERSYEEYVNFEHENLFTPHVSNNCERDTENFKFIFPPETSSVESIDRDKLTCLSEEFLARSEIDGNIPLDSATYHEAEKVSSENETRSYARNMRSFESESSWSPRYVNIEITNESIVENNIPSQIANFDNTAPAKADEQVEESETRFDQSSSKFNIPPSLNVDKSSMVSDKQNTEELIAGMDRCDISRWRVHKSSCKKGKSYEIVCPKQPAKELKSISSSNLKIFTERDEERHVTINITSDSASCSIAEAKRRLNVETFLKQKMQATAKMKPTTRAIPIRRTQDFEFIVGELENRNCSCTESKAMPKQTSFQMDIKVEAFAAGGETRTADEGPLQATVRDYTNLVDADAEVLSVNMTPTRKRILDTSRSIRSPKYSYKMPHKTRNTHFVYRSKPSLQNKMIEDPYAYILKKGQNEMCEDDIEKHRQPPRGSHRASDPYDRQSRHTIIDRQHSSTNLNVSFDDKFRRYAGRGPSNSELISYKRSTKWLKDAGLVGTAFTAEEANDAFKCTAGLKVTLNKEDYRNFLIKLTRLKKLNYNRVCEKLCAANSQ